MKIYLKTFLFACLLTLNGYSQNVFTKTGKIDILAKDHPTLNASSRTAVVVMDTKSGDINFSVLMQSLQFEKAGMQEKFNAKIMESEKYPKGEFKGVIKNIQSVNFSKDGDYPVTVEGELILHGVMQKITTDGTITVQGKNLSTKSSFVVQIDDYKVSNPGIGDGKITITVDCLLEPMPSKS